MARSIPADRIARLARTAADVFIAQGYRRTQMADVAQALGVAKGTLYLYVESKEALLDLALRHADSNEPVALPETLPIPTPAAGATMDFASTAFAARAKMPLLAAATLAKTPADLGAEVEAIVREIYALCADNRRSIKLIDRCAPDHPELAALWFEGGREGLMAAVVEYLVRRPQLAADFPDKAVLARLLIEMIVFWACHRHWDPHPQEIDESVAEETVVSFVRRALIQEIKQ